MKNLNISIPTLLLSRTFWTTACELLFIVVVHFVPELEQNLPQIIGSSLILAGIVAGKFGLTDVFLAAKHGHENAKYRKNE